MDKSVLLEMQLKDALDRETNSKKLNDSLRKAMGDILNHDKGSEIQLLNQLHDQEISKLKTILNEKITILEYEANLYLYLVSKQMLRIQQIRKKIQLIIAN